MRANRVGPRPRSNHRHHNLGRHGAALLVLIAAAALSLVGCLDDGAGAELSDSTDTGSVPDDEFGSLDTTAPQDDGTDSTSVEPVVPDFNVELVGIMDDGLELRPVDQIASDASGITMTRVLARDLDGDGFLDMVGLTASGDVYASHMQRSKLRPPFDFHPLAGPFASGIAEGELDSGDFDGDGRPDIVVVDRSTATPRVAVLRNLGFGLFSSPQAFEDPLVGFEDPLVGFEDPLVGARRTWVVADLDANGYDDIVLVRSASELVFMLSGPGRLGGSPVSFKLHPQSLVGFEDPLVGFEDPLVGFEDPLVGFEDPLVGIPTSIVAVQLDGDAGIELVLSYDAFDQLGFSGLVAFEDPLVGFEDPLVGFEDPLVGYGDLTANAGRVLLPGKVRSVIATRLDDGDMQTDLIALSHGADGRSVVALPSLAAFEDPLVGLESGFFSIDGTFDCINATSIVGEGGALGSGSSGLPLVPVSELVVSNRDGMVVLQRSVDGTALTARRLVDSGALSVMQVVDFNGDGFGEFVGQSGDFKYGAQLELEHATGNFDGDGLQPSAALVCEVSKPLCAGGRLGVCADAHAGCDDECLPNEGVTNWEALYEAGSESHCDTLDNDCDGQVDVVTPLRAITVPLSGVGATATARRVEGVITPAGSELLVQVEDGTELILLRGLFDPATDNPTALSEIDGMPRLPLDAGTQMVTAFAGDELCVLTDTGTTVGAAIVRPGQAAEFFSTALTGLSTARAVQGLGGWHIVDASNGRVTVASIGTSKSNEVFSYLGTIQELAVAGSESAIFVLLRTDSERLYLLDIGVAAQQDFALRDVHQLPVGSGRALSGLSATASSAGPDASTVLCVAWAGSGGDNPHLAAQRIEAAADGLHLEAPVVLSHQSVDSDSVHLTSSLGRCQMTWTELPEADSEVRLLRQAYLDRTPLVQDLSAFPGPVATSLMAADARELGVLTVLSDGTLTASGLTLSAGQLCR